MGLTAHPSPTVVVLVTLVADPSEPPIPFHPFPSLGVSRRPMPPETSPTVDEAVEAVAVAVAVGPTTSTSDALVGSAQQPEPQPQGQSSSASTPVPPTDLIASTSREGQGCDEHTRERHGVPSGVPPPRKSPPPSSSSSTPSPSGPSAEEVYREALRFDELHPHRPYGSPRLNPHRTSPRLAPRSPAATQPLPPPLPPRTQWYPSADRVISATNAFLRPEQTDRGVLRKECWEAEEEEKREIPFLHLSDAEEYVLASEALGWEGTHYDAFGTGAAWAEAHSDDRYCDNPHSSHNSNRHINDSDDGDPDLSQLKRQAYDPWHGAAPPSRSPHVAVLENSDDPSLHNLRVASARMVSTGSAVHAEWIGLEPGDSNNESGIGTTAAAAAALEWEGEGSAMAYAATAAPHASVATVSTVWWSATASAATADATTAEVEVLDSAPWPPSLPPTSDHSVDVPAWKCTGEAQVLLENDCGAEGEFLDDSKPPAAAASAAAVAMLPDRYGDGNEDGGEVADAGFVEAHAEAEVLGIRHELEVHPLELEEEESAAHFGGGGGGGAHAELVGVVAEATEEESSVAYAATASAESHYVSDTTPTAAAVAVLTEYDVEQTPTASNVTVIRSGFANAPPLPPRNPFGRLSNPFEDDPSDPPALSRDAIAQLDAQADNSWMTVPTAVLDPTIEPATPVAATLPVTSESTEATPPPPRPLKTVESEMAPRNWDDEDNNHNSNAEEFYRPHRNGEVPDWLRDDGGRDPPMRPPPPPRPFGSGPETRSASQASGFSSGSHGQRITTGGPAITGGPGGAGGGIFMVHLMGLECACLVFQRVSHRVASDP